MARSRGISASYQGTRDRSSLSLAAAPGPVQLTVLSLVEEMPLSSPGQPRSHTSLYSAQAVTAAAARETEDWLACSTRPAPSRFSAERDPVSRFLTGRTARPAVAACRARPPTSSWAAYATRKAVPTMVLSCSAWCGVSSRKVWHCWMWCCELGWRAM